MPENVLAELSSKHVVQPMTGGDDARTLSKRRVLFNQFESHLIPTGVPSPVGFLFQLFCCFRQNRLKDAFEIVMLRLRINTRRKETSNSMKVMAFNGSARKDGNTAILINYVLKELQKEGIKTEHLQLAGQRIKGCTACYKCFDNKNRQCVFDDDILNTCLEKMAEADGIILGSPTYYTDVSTEMKALIDRSGFVSRANGDILQRKLGAAVVSMRRAGSIHAFDTINHFFLISQMIIAGSIYWNMGIGGRDKGEVEKDEEGIKTMAVLGQNMAWLLKKMKR
jgi:multimeric flavodoxin WrbA